MALPGRKSIKVKGISILTKEKRSPATPREWKTRGFHAMEYGRRKMGRGSREMWGGQKEPRSHREPKETKEISPGACHATPLII